MNRYPLTRLGATLLLFGAMCLAVSSASADTNSLWKPSAARWIWLEGEEKPANAFVQFRRAFSLDEIPAEAKIYASADCKYLLFMNGQVVGRGPITTDPRYKQVDVYDVHKCVKQGPNTISALVLQRHAKTSRLWPVRGGFLLEFRSPDLTFGTDESWKARWALEYQSDVPRMTHQYGFQEWLDARKAVPGWNSTEFDDGDWKSALVVPASEQYWPAELEIRTVAHMLRDVRFPTRLVGYFSAGANGLKPEQYYEPAQQIYLAYMGHSILVWNEEGIVAPAKGPAIFQENSFDGLGFVVDLGEEMLGYPFIEFECPEGVVVDLGHGEVLSRNRVQTVLLPGCESPQRYADRYISRGGRQRWEIFDTKGCRYLEIHFRNLSPDASGKKRVTIYEVGLVRSRAPDASETEFTCSDERMNRTFDISRRTLEVLNQDWHICDAQREQNMWLEPFQEMMHLQVFGRLEMHRKTLQMFARGQLEEGFLSSTIPPINETEPTAAHQYIFTTYSYPVVVYLDWLYGGYDPRHEKMLATCVRIFDALAQYIGEDGVPRNTPGSHWCEWSGIDTRPSDVNGNVKASWEVTYFAAHLVLSLECAAKMADALGRKDLAEKWNLAADRVRESANRRYWSEERKAYIDGIYDGVPSETVSQTTNAIAVLARLGDEQRLRTAMRTVLNPKTCDVPCQINQQTFFHEALQSLDMDAVVPERIRRLYGKMLDLGATTTWEGEFALERANGCCFGFAANPLWYMVHNFLGVIPLEPGYRKFSVRIAPHDLQYARGKVATPNGYIGISWRRENDALEAEIDVPDGCQAVVAAPRGTEWIERVKMRVDGKDAELVPLMAARCTYILSPMKGCVMDGGIHQVEFRQ